MRDLATLTNEELIAYYWDMQEAESIEYLMDGSGECGAMIAATFDPIWESFDKEFDRREISDSSIYPEY